MSRSKLLSAAALALGLSIATTQAALAADQSAYTQQAFAASQREGRPILVDIAASWCPICAKQHPIIEGLAKEPAFHNLVIYRVDFDTQKDVVRAMGAQMQSTLIVFHGAAEKGRSTGDTNPESIRALLQKAN